MADHSIRVAMLLTGDVYLAMQSMADRIRSGDTTEPAQVLHSRFHGVQ